MSASENAGFSSAARTRQLVSALLRKKRVNTEENESISVRPVYSPCPASFAQQRLWLIDQMSKDSRYNLQVSLHLEERLDLAALSDAWREILGRHESLRTTFGVVDEQIMQFISPGLQPSLSVVDLSEENVSDRASRIRGVLEQQGQQEFDLAHGPLVRPVILKIRPEEYILCFTMHHIISDGWSLTVLVREFKELYAAFSKGLPSPLVPLAIQYADFAWWQRQRLSGDLLETHLGYWRKQLNGAPVLDLPADRPRPQKESFTGSQWYFAIPEELTGRLRELGRRNQASLFMVLLAAWQVLLCRYSGQTDIVIGSPIANRTRVEIEPLIGFFVNTLVLRTNLDGNPNFKEVLSRVRGTTLDAYEHQDVPYEMLVAELRRERTASQSPFFGTMLNWVNTPDLESVGVQTGSAPLENATAKFDLTLHIMEKNAALPAGFEYSTALYEKATIERMAAHFHNLLESVARDADQPISGLPFLGREERSQLLYAWSHATHEVPARETLVQLLETQAHKTPDAPALFFEGEAWSYRELHERANQLAHFLKGLGVGPEVPVGVCMERGPQLVMALVAILKAGGAYVPLDPGYPAERLMYMLEDSRAPVLLVRQSLADLLPSFPRTVIKLDAQWDQITRQSVANPERTALPENLAYVIYTSGSTGRPKGVAIRHSSASVMLRWAHQAFSPQRLAGVLASTSICFDLSVFEIFAPLSCGGAALIAANALAFPGMEHVERVTLVNTVPSAVRALIKARALPGSVRTVNLAGEALSAELAAEVYAASAAEQVFNLYGPSEDTTYSTFACVEREAVTVPIGRPIANTRAYVLDGWMQPAPAGVPGELYLGGAGLARGYLHRPALTAEKFVPDPFTSAPGERLYKTGDRVRWRPDGTLEFLGRADQQVKLRGFRIELGEIESVLLSHQKIREAAVLLRDIGSSEKQIVAFVAPGGDSPPGIQELRQYVKRLLPSYMAPSLYVFVDRLPLNANGKIDRKSLALTQAPAEARKIISPRTPTEKALCGIWADVLKREEVGVEDDFFALGGHSLLAVNLVSQITRRFGCDLGLIDMLQHPTPAEMASLIDQGEKGTSDSALICMNQGRPDVPPLYLMHPIGGNVFCYSDLTRFFADGKPFYAIQALPQESFQDVTLEHAASVYLQLIRTRKPHGRYELGGWSFGALLAFEMAQQAAAAGDPPAALYLLDPPPPEQLQLDLLPEEELISDFVLTLIADFNGGNFPDLEKLKAEFDPQGKSLEAQLQKAAEMGLLPANTLIAAHAKYFATFKRNLQRMRLYRPRKYPGRTILVLPKTTPSTWQALLPANTGIVYVSGNHFTMIRGSSAARIAGVLEAGADSLPF